MTIAQNGSGSQYFSGLIDEVRLSSIARSANWINFEYYNMSSTNNETIFANQEIYEE